LLALQKFLKEDSVMKDDLLRAEVNEAVAKQGGTNTYNTTTFAGSHNQGMQVGQGGPHSVFTNNVTDSGAK